MTIDIGPQIDETGWERAYVNILMRELDVPEVATWDRTRLHELLVKLLAPYGATEYEIDRITNAVGAKLRDYVLPADSPPAQTREERLYR